MQEKKRRSGGEDEGGNYFNKREREEKMENARKVRGCRTRLRWKNKKKIIQKQE